MSDLTIVEKGAFSFIMMLLRYALFSGIPFLLLYVIGKRKWIRRKIQARFPSAARMRTEVAYSIFTLAIFSLIAMGVVWLNLNGYIKIYKSVAEYGWAYFVISLALMLFIHDTYFYWMHRWMHATKWFRRIHAIHHLSHNPSPWAAFSFHPLEAIVEGGVIVVIVALMPVHIIALLIFLLLSQGMNVVGHLGYELFPAHFLKHPIGKWLNTATHHNMHHRFSSCNYGLYFNFWDKWMGTNHRDYEQTFDRIHTATTENKNA